MPLIELSIGSEWYKDQNWQKICEDSSKAAFDVSPYGSILNTGFVIEISVKLSDNEEVQRLNNSFRGKNKPTNVLSFPLFEKDLLKSLSNTNDGEMLLGDIILAKTVCQTEAEEKNIALETHVSHLLVHGTLHLLGYDHQEESEALHMEELEVKALQTLGIANPYHDDEVKR